MTEREKGGSGGDLDGVLADLRALSGDMASCAVLAKDGSLLSSSHKPGVDRERVVAMLSAVSNLADRAAKGSGKDNAAQVRVDTENGHFLLVRLEGGALAATTGPDARVGLVLYDMRNAREAVEKAIRGGGQS